MTAPTRGMVLAAGLGLRMRPLTDNCPKPLIPVAGRSMLDRALDHLAAAGVTACVVNSHYLAPMIAAHLARRRAENRDRMVLELSHEPQILDTGGGVAQALPVFGTQPFYVANGDVLWRDGAQPSLAKLAAAWDDAEMDALLLVHPIANAIGYDGAGDFFLDADGRLRRRGDAAQAPFVFTGVQILHPRLFVAAPAGAFSLNRLYDSAARAGRLFGLAHDGEWYHIGTPDGLRRAEECLRQEASP